MLKFSKKLSDKILFVHFHLAVHVLSVGIIKSVKKSAHFIFSEHSMTQSQNLFYTRSLKR